MSQADVERRHLRAQNVDVIMRPQIDVQQRAVGVTHVGNSITGSDYVGRLAPEEDHTLLGDQDPELGQDEGPTEMSANRQHQCRREGRGICDSQDHAERQA